MSRIRRRFTGIRIVTKRDILRGMADRYATMGNRCRRRGDLEGAEEAYRRAVEIAGRLHRSEAPE